ncbi:alkyl hydroperoxide reductase AhpD [Iodidimonas nitroreducens]|uniref:Alkyl hydroperoxide reductase AhpD n=1 Tax=Iodidimonas nitroreducens TaxID=1236968 RepID=A0A5A7N4H3_9PROT|nr:peroxidase-related enzyme [Iodidimonas nitroreducens]GAK32205.1 putative peroxidase-related enzyme [alpha proteobacterium Q-1]GER02625.1 alkyl hydroperoxide reductase AhpD [Iodidimonas nitroreducens]
MSFLPSLPRKTNLSDVIKGFPVAWEPLFDFHDVVLRGESPLSIGERELIAAYVSGLNHCHFCYNAHRVYAESYGFAPDVTPALLDDLATAPIDDALRPILAYAGKLTIRPSDVTAADVAAILDAGWDETAVADTNKVAALFNYMNRVILGMGVDDFNDFYARRLEAVRAQPIEERKAANQKDLNTRHYRGYGVQLGVISE